jgi:uncharacterized protein (DUF169 family)
MTSIGELNRCGEELEQYLLLSSSPVAVKLLPAEADTPPGAKRPRRDLGRQMAMCQALALARRDGETIAMFKEDHSCFVPVIGLGLAEPPQDFLDGKTKYPWGIADEQSAREWARDWARLEYGRCAGFVAAPLKTAGFAPDVIVIYCTPAQLRHLLIAMHMRQGCVIKANLDPLSGCIQCTVPSILNNECHVTVPDPGDHVRALAREDEMIFSVPGGRLEELMEGLRHAQQRGKTYRTTTREMNYDHWKPELYRRMGEQLGMDMKNWKTEG